MRFFLLSYFALLSFFLGQASPISTISNQITIQVDSIAPKVFALGENIALETSLNKVYPEGIVDIYNGDAQTAFSHWANMLRELDTYAEAENYDLKGLKAFVTFYWNKNGEIEHIAYSLKAHSLFVKKPVLESFFQSFMYIYRLPIKAKVGFQHTFTLALPYPTIVKSASSKLNTNPN